MRRRDFIGGLGGAAAWPVGAWAQQHAMPVIGFMSSRSPSDSVHLVKAFHQGLNESGFVEGRNVVIEYRWGEGNYDRLPALAAELVNLPVTVLVAVGGDPSAQAAKRATSTIPIVFGAGSDPAQPAWWRASIGRVAMLPE
jgi:putative ABC transport system substrate-binding protein